MLAFQFFITMGETPELNNKHTLFGKVVGHTVYNMIKLQDGELEDDRPVRPHKIVRTKVLINPFPDIEPRKLIKVEFQDKEKYSAPFECKLVVRFRFI
jgi:peptidyl-prolyl cis-trans isomerase SDCCAG10